VSGNCRATMPPTLLTPYPLPLTLYLQSHSMTAPNLPIWSDGTSLGTGA
jgi:hypothetical protein